MEQSTSTPFSILEDAPWGNHLKGVGAAGQEKQAGIAICRTGEVGQGRCPVVYDLDLLRSLASKSRKNAIS